MTVQASCSFNAFADVLCFSSCLNVSTSFGPDDKDLSFPPWVKIMGVCVEGSLAVCEQQYDVTWQFFSMI